MEDMEDKLVHYQINGESAQGYLVIVPEPFDYSSTGSTTLTTGSLTAGTQGKLESKGGVVVIQEWWGLNDNIKDIASRVAELGYVTIAPDLYDGKVATEPDEAQKLRMEMELSKAVKKIAKAAQYLKNEHGVEKVGCMGFCMGGTLTLLGATTGEFAAVVPFYGRITDDITSGIDKIKVPVLGIYGTEDHGIPVESVKELKRQLEGNKVVNEFHFYKAGHAFFNDTRPESYNKEASADAWEKVKAWFEKYLS